jgi:hypothetical protein
MVRVFFESQNSKKRQQFKKDEVEVWDTEDL